ncbi:unnamed protein product [Cochlearia groenlandica]
MGDAMKSAARLLIDHGPFSDVAGSDNGFSYDFSSLVGGPTVFRTGSAEPSSSGTILKKKKFRKRPYKIKRKPRVSAPYFSEGNETVSAQEGSSCLNKRKANEEENKQHKTTRRDLQEVVPKRGLPNL